jgi:hypothetical protein
LAPPGDLASKKAARDELSTLSVDLRGWTNVSALSDPPPSNARERQGEGDNIPAEDVLSEWDDRSVVGVCE